MLQLLELSLVAILVLLTLLLDRVAVVLQSITSMSVLFFQGANLLVFLLYPQFKISAALAFCAVGELMIF